MNKNFIKKSAEKELSKKYLNIIIALKKVR